MAMRISRTSYAIGILSGLFLAAGAQAQLAPAPTSARPAAGRGQQGPQVVSPEVKADRKVTFRILAPQAQSVRLNAGDIPGQGGAARDLTKAENGVWELTLGPIDPGAYRYTFNVNGVTVIDPRSPATSESNNNVWSVVYVPGSDFMDELDVPHGAVAAVHYHSSTLSKMRRMHVYTPPGYEAGSEKYPVFYLLHGASDSDDSWTSEGRANFILDNLIAAKKVKPMIVVMPAGHTGPQREGGGGGGGSFENDFVKDIAPYVEGHYRVLPGKANRAIAGLSMGGGQTLSIALAHPQDYAYVGVFSSGLFQRNLPDWEKQNQEMLDKAGKEGFKLFWLKTGKDDFLIQTTHNTVDLLKRHNMNPVFAESTGGHTWINWRNYLNEFAPQLFQ
jgi:enterochelin esterase-like enzyme